uniref:Treble clef zinc finger domain-containing protein n=1 Tax=viral metagenome TaxID=1070528 RepID=A0A6C0KLV7_9ZZZZ
MSCLPTSKKLCGLSTCNLCFQRSFASHPKAICWSDKNEMTPMEVTKSSNKMYWFDCETCGHELYMIVKNVSNGQWCNYCKGSGLCESDDCIFCFEKSFASHPMASCWSPDNKINPRMVVRGSEKKYLFVCNDCDHIFTTAPSIIKNKKHCPYCSNQKMCEKKECESCFKKSCASHNMNKAWLDTNDNTPRQVFLQSNKKIKFNCLLCKHVYETTPSHYYNRNGSCPYCANKYLCEEESCRTCFEKSFASHPKVDCWSPKNKIAPRDMFKGSETKCIFDCDKCNSEFESKLYNVLTGYWCPFCKNKTEGKMFRFLTEQYSECKSQIRFDWCRFSKTNNIMPFDFGMLDKKILIELDGEQHFNQISKWDAPEDVQKKDVEKMKCCMEQGYSMIRMYQVDVWKDTYDWKEMLNATILSLQNKDPCIVFISTNDIYCKHIEQVGNSTYQYIHPIL